MNPFNLDNFKRALAYGVTPNNSITSPGVANTYGSNGYIAPTPVVPMAQTPIVSQNTSSYSQTNPTSNVVGNGTGSVDYSDPNQLAGAITAAIQPAQPTPTQQYYQTRGQQMDDRLFNRGAYYIDPNAGFSPSQVEQKQNSADKLYGAQLDTIASDANSTGSSYNSLMNTKTTASPYISALLTSPKIGASSVDTKRILSQLSTLPPDAQIATIKQITYNNLDSTQKGNYDSNQNAAETAQYALSQVPEDLLNNPYKYNLNNYITYFGGVKDPKYTNFVQNISSVVAPIRKSFFGASLTSSEQAAANQFLPNPETDDTKTLVLKTKNVAAIAQYANDAMIANTLGLPKPKLADYVAGVEKSTSNANPDQAAIDAGYSQEEINAYKKSKGISFNSVGNTTASIPKESRLAYVNNNPGNLKYAGQMGATEGEGGFAKFSSPTAGLVALTNQIKLDTSRGHTLASFIAKYAPANENNTNQYLTQASSTLGVPPQTPLNKIPLDALTKFIALKESSTKVS